MANRNFNRYQALEKEVKTLFADVAIGATGAPTLTYGLGIASIARSGAGEYLITLQDKYNRLMSVSVIDVQATNQDLTYSVDSEDVASAKTLTVVCKAAATSTDPTSGSRLLIRIDVKNSSV